MLPEELYIMFFLMSIMFNKSSINSNQYTLLQCKELLVQNMNIKKKFITKLQANFFRDRNMIGNINGQVLSVKSCFYFLRYQNLLDFGGFFLTFFLSISVLNWRSLRSRPTWPPHVTSGVLVPTTTLNPSVALMALPISPPATLVVRSSLLTSLQRKKWW